MVLGSFVCLRDSEVVGIWTKKFPGLFAGQVKPHGSGRVGSLDPTRLAKNFTCLDPTRPDPRDFENFLTLPYPTRPDPTREI